MYIKKSSFHAINDKLKDVGYQLEIAGLEEMDKMQLIFEDWEFLPITVSRIDDFGPYVIGDDQFDLTFFTVDKYVNVDQFETYLNKYHKLVAILREIEQQNSLYHNR